MKKNPPFTKMQRIFISDILIGFQIGNKKQGGALSPKISEPLYLIMIYHNETSFSLIHLAGQYVSVDGKVGWLKKSKEHQKRLQKFFSGTCHS